MSLDSGTDSSGNDAQPPDDQELVARLLAGDENALRELISRYDRLVRYTIFKAGRSYCDRDPGWLDARANESWSGIVQSLRSGGVDRIPPNISSYFIQIARNKAIDAAKKAARRDVIPFEEAQRHADKAAGDQDHDPAAVIDGVEQLEALRDCIGRLSDYDRLVCAEMGLILERRWKEAADRLELPESTLRSRWQGIQQRLKSCLDRQSEKKAK